MQGEVLLRSQSGEPTVTEFSETVEEQRARIKASAEAARRRFNLTPGQRDTLRQAAAARRAATV